MNKEDLKKIKYVNINRHSTYSTLKGLDNVKQILKESVDKGFEGASILDLYNMAAALPFYQFSRDSALLSKLGVDKNIPIILGCQLNIVPSLMDRDNRENRISIIAKNEIGFSNLCKLTSISYLPDHFYKIPKITLQELLDNKEGLIVTTGGMNGIIPQDIYMRTANAKSNFELFKKEFGEDFYVELHIHNLTKDLEWSYRKKQHDDLGFDPQEIVNKRLVELAKQYNVKCYFAQNSFMKNKSSHLLQKIQIGNSLDGKTGWHYQNPMYTMSVEEMYEYIQENSPYLLDIIDFKEACENSVEILNKSKDIELKFEPALPDIKYNECNVNIGERHKDLEKELESLREIGDKPLNFLLDKSESDPALRTTFKIILRNKKIDFYNKEERERLVFELFTIQRNGIIDLCDYFLLLEDVTNFLNENKWLRGFARGCLTGDTLVLTTMGYKKLKDIKKGEKVYTSSGEEKKVIKTFEYNIDEKILSISAVNEIHPIKLTKDHKVWAAKRELRREWLNTTKSRKNKIRKYEKVKEKDFKWIEASELEEGDLLKFIKPKRKIKDIEVINFKKYSNKNFKEEGEFLRFKDNKNYKIKKEVFFDKEFAYMVGKWIGDGWIRNDKEKRRYCVGFAFNSKEKKEIDRTLEFFKEKLGLIGKIYKSKEKNLVQVVFYSKILTNFFVDSFPCYEKTSRTKHLSYFKYLPDEKLRSLLKGYISADGHTRKYSETITTTSIKLALDVKEALQYLNITSSWTERGPYESQGYQMRRSYALKFRGINIEAKDTSNIVDNGYYVKVKNTEEISGYKKVYDLMIEDNPSYLTSNFLVHNSGAGSILAYATDITDCHPLEFTLLFERFLTKARVGQKNFQVNDYDIQEAYKNFNLYRDFDPEQKAFKKIKDLVDKKECPKYLEEYKEKELYYLDCNQEIAEYIVSHLDKKMDKNVNNSTILFLLGITDEEPTKSITATPTGLPDIDYDAETSEFVNARDEIKTYCRDKYGNDHVALLGTYMTLQLKGTVKDVCRQLHPEIPFLEINKLTKKFDVLSPLDFKSPLKYFLAIMEEDSDVEKWFNDRPQTKRAVAELLGNVKSTGIHAGGVVVTKKDIKNHIPLHFERAQGFWVTQPEMAYVEWAGFIKYDFLGLKTLSYISECMRLIRERHGKNYNFKNINYDEKEVLNEFCNGDITSFFQFDTPTARPWVQSLNKINNIVDLAIGTSALRPGPMNMGMHEELLQRINGEKPVTYLHKSLEPILKETYGIVIFQEQVMIIVREIGGLSEDESLIVMKAMSKKKFDKLIVYKDIFIDSAVKNHGMDKSLAESIWELLAAFAEYGFNKSHAVAYAHTSYLCAWFKHHYFMEWISAVLTIGSKDDFKAFYQKWKKHVLKPDINESKEKYNIATIKENEKDVEKVVMPISSVNGVGAKAVEEIISKQPFTDFDDFFNRINLRVCKKNVVISLILSGCFDSFNDGKTVMYQGEYLKKDTSANFFRKVLCQYFYMLSHKKSKPPKTTRERDNEKLREIAAMNKGHMLLKEISLLNFTSFDYNDYYRDKLDIVEKKKRVTIVNPEDIQDLPDGARVACVGASMDLTLFYTKKKQKMGRFILSNNGENVDITVFPRALEQDEMGKGTINKLIDYFPLVIIGTVNEFNGKKSIIFDEGVPLIKME